MSATTDGFVTVAKVGEIAEGTCKIVRVDDQSVAVYLIDGAYYAIDDVCTHDGGPLAEGPLEGAVVECPRHGARFDVRTGQVLAPPATVPVPTYAVRVVGDDVQIGWA